ncbi:MAG: RNA 2'-phosphotransferase [Phycisphaerae bacterium]|jgi:putative RNA 2'-phosphotransferase|nr:RNA 2'-phosphotransferase [Phycisphaerae bacterium]
MDPSLIRTSKFLSLILRHKPATLGLTLDDAGWIGISDLIDAANAYGKKLDLDLLLRVVHENDKQRFAISEDGEMIRANQGHSIDVDLELAPIQPPTQLFHGTVERFLRGIREKGLIPGNRQHVHLSTDAQTAEIVGRRRGKPVVLVIEAERMASDAIDFYLSQNGVWLTAHVPVNYIEFP